MVWHSSSRMSSATALGAGSGGLGYSGIPNSLAVEFDTFANPWDPSSNHVAVQSCGTQPNSPMHTWHLSGGSGISINSHPALGRDLRHFRQVHRRRTARSGHSSTLQPNPANGNGTLKVWIDPPFILELTPRVEPHRLCPCSINIPYNIDNTYNSHGISLAGGTSAWVGFSASQTTVPQAHDILAWEFTPHAPAAGTAGQFLRVVLPAYYIFGSARYGRDLLLRTS